MQNLSRSSMKTYRITIKPQTAFGSMLLGESLFGQLCWLYRSFLGEESLTNALERYSEGDPFMVVSDAFVSGYLPLPHLPGTEYDESTEGLDRKALKKKQWVKFSDITRPAASLRNCALSGKELFEAEDGCDTYKSEAHIHATINRLTATTGFDEFAPYITKDLFFKKDLCFDIYAVVDEKYISDELLEKLFISLGNTGYGRDASVGLGKFCVEKLETLSNQVNSTSVLALASCSPCLDDIDAEKTYYRTKTHFGKHGDIGVFGGNPFKKPILLAKSGAVLSFKSAHTKPYAGIGLKGVSTVISGAVHQGYAPVIGLNF